MYSVEVLLPVVMEQFDRLDGDEEEQFDRLDGDEEDEITEGLVG